VTTWTPKTENSNSWTADNFPARVFSPLVFSHAFVATKRVFTLGTSQGVWDIDGAPASVWTAE